METPTSFDTYNFSKKLEKSGFSKKQSETLVEGIKEAHDITVSNLATKEDLAATKEDLKSELKEELNAIRHDFELEFKDVRSEMLAIKYDLELELKDVRSEIKDVRSEIQEVKGTLRNEIKNVEIRLTKTLAALFAGQTAVMLTAVFTIVKLA